ncbi:MAG: 1-acyl-sn-glycerol-3-phosphate acyltransferase [Anaerolineales bacterium]|jgi:hypothetical protein
MPEDPLKDFLRNKGYEGIFYTLNWPRTALTERLVNRLFGGIVETLLDLGVTFDHKIGEESVNAACQWVVDQCGTPIDVHGVDLIPNEGPVLIASNHPGLFDSMVIISMLQRQDLKIVAGGVHYFAELPNARQYLLYLDAETSTRVLALRGAIRHLEAGGCVLIFPTGETDPDPDAVPGARERLAEWSDSVALMLRRVPECKLVPTAVSGILNPRYMKHLITRIQPNPRYRPRVAELMQIFAQFRKPGLPPLSKPRVTFGQAITGGELLTRGGKSDLMRHVRMLAENILEEHLYYSLEGIS